jgi:hypothetical protein
MQGDGHFSQSRCEESQSVSIVFVGRGPTCGVQLLTSSEEESYGLRQSAACGTTGNVVYLSHIDD